MFHFLHGEFKKTRKRISSEYCEKANALIRQTTKEDRVFCFFYRGGDAVGASQDMEQDNQENVGVICLL